MIKFTVSDVFDIKMTKDEFLLMPLSRLSRLTKVSGSTLSRYFCGTRKPNERSLVEMSEQLEVLPGNLLNWIIERREMNLTSRFRK